jgi:GNAT superfamily N-acetyltransferase
LSQTILFSDRALSQRLELAEGMANAAFVEARGGQWMEVSGTRAAFDTPDSPITQTFGLGMFGEVTADDLDRIEAFFKERGAPTHHEISPLADASVWPLIAARGYEAFEFTSILCLDLNNGSLPEAPAANGFTVRLARADEADVYGRTAALGWDMTSALMDACFVTAGVSSFLVEKDGVAVATGALNIQNGVALLAGASTLPEVRRQGAQRLLLGERLRFAREAGCEIAAMGALPGSESQRNAQRAGFQIAYTRTKWRKRV